VDKRNTSYVKLWAIHKIRLSINNSRVYFSFEQEVGFKEQYGYCTFESDPKNTNNSHIKIQNIFKLNTIKPRVKKSLLEKKFPFILH